ncbi:MAG: hypothetical protein ACI9QD_001024 [Thermoproteota archaeon]|jgi:hypothetical protein
MAGVKSGLFLSKLKLLPKHSEKRGMKNLLILPLLFIVPLAYSVEVIDFDHKCEDSYKTKNSKKRTKFYKVGKVEKFFNGLKMKAKLKGVTFSGEGSSSSSYSSKINKSVKLLSTYVLNSSYLTSLGGDNDEAKKLFNKFYKKAKKRDKKLTQTKFQEYIQQGFSDGTFCPKEKKFYGPKKILKYALEAVKDNLVADGLTQVVDVNKPFTKEESLAEETPSTGNLENSDQ